MCNVFEHIEIILESDDISIAYITEHWLKEAEIDGINIDNYKLCSIYCRSMFKNGSIAIFCKNCFNDHVKELDYLKHYSIEKIFEICDIEVKLADICFFVLVICRSTSGDLDQFFIKLENVLNIICKHNVPIIICGDQY